MNRQRVLSLLLALVMVLGAFGIVSASETNKSEANDSKIQWLKDNEVVVGRKVNENEADNDLALDKNVTRAEITKLIVHTLGKQDLADALDGVVKPFPDVDLDHWANGFISVAATERVNEKNPNGIIIGYPDGEFKPSNNVTYAELATMLVRIVKDDLTKEMEDRAIWATDYMRWAEEEGILKGIKVLDSDAAIDRYDAFVMIYNAMDEIGRIKDNKKAKFGDDLGIISRVQSGKIQFNNDKDKVYDTNWNTMVSRGTNWNEISSNVNRGLVGALARYITDGEGNITHIVVLGQNGIAADEKRWAGVAEKAIPDRTQATARLSDRYDDADITINGVTAKINKDTRIFVADVNNNAFGEVKNLADVFKLYINKARDLKDVYMGYDVVVGRNIAKVVVFGNVDKYQGLNDVRRITRWLNTNRDFMAENTKGEETRYNIAQTTGFPSHDYVDVKDVVRVRDGYWELYPDLVIIDYSKDNVYEVVDIFDNNKGLELRDRYGNRQQFYIGDADIFTEKEFKKGVHVQIAFNNPVDENKPITNSKDKVEIDYISVVDKALKGELKGGVYVGNAKGYLKEVVPVTGTTTAGYKYIARFAETASGSGVKDYYVTELDANILTIYRSRPEARRELTFDVRDELGGTKVAYNFQFTQDEIVRMAEDAVNAYERNRTDANYNTAKNLIDDIKNKEADRKKLEDRLAALRGNRAVKAAPTLVLQETQLGGNLKIYKVSAPDFPEAREFESYNFLGGLSLEKGPMDRTIGVWNDPNADHVTLVLFDANGGEVFRGRVNL